MFGNYAEEQIEGQHRELWLRGKAIGRQRFIWRSICVVKFVFALTFLITCLPGTRAQQSDSGQTTLRARSTLVMVPVLVTTKRGQIVFGLTANDFHLTDDGVQQHVVLEQDTDAQPLALAIVVQIGGAGARHLNDYQGLDAILDTLIGEVDHRVAVIGFDSAPHVVVPFTLNTEQASRRLGNLTEGGQGAAILDAVVFAVGQLSEQPARYRRAILLLSETVDQGSKTNLSDALRLVSDTNTSIYSFAFSSTRSAVAHEASKLNGANPGPAHGCLSREGADSEYEGHYDKQVLDCISQLAPPLRLATMSFLAARSALRTNTAEFIAQLAGGEFFHFHDAKDLEAGLITASNHVPNHYVLSFRPVSPTPGLHALHVEAKDHSQLVLKSRREYWIDSDTTPED